MYISIIDRAERGISKEDLACALAIAQQYASGEEQFICEMAGTPWLMVGADVDMQDFAGKWNLTLLHTTTARHIHTTGWIQNPVLRHGLASPEGPKFAAETLSAACEAVGKLTGNIETQIHTPEGIGIFAICLMNRMEQVK